MNLKAPRSKDSSIWDCRSQISRFEARTEADWDGEGGLIRFAFNQFTKRAMHIQNTHRSVLLSRRGVASDTSLLRVYLSSPLLIYRKLFVTLLKAICFNLRLNEEGQIIIISTNNNYRMIILIYSLNDYSNLLNE